MRQVFFLIIFLFSLSTGAFAQLQLTDQINPELLNKKWSAKWITCPNISGTEFGVYLFRKTFTVASAPKQFIVHVSADNRYKLYVNEKQVATGPASGDLLNWHFESIDIAPLLQEGKNTIAAVVWNFANYRPLAQVSGQTGFILQGNSATENAVKTDAAWRVTKDLAYAPINNKPRDVGPGEKFTCQANPWGGRKLISTIRLGARLRN